MPGAHLTESDRRFLEVAITCLKEPPQLDVPKIAERLGIKNKSVTNKWWEIKKKLWGEEVARAAGEKTRQLATAAGVKRKRDEKAANPPPPRPAKEKLKWYDLPPNIMTAPTTTTATPAAMDNAAAAAPPTVSYSYGAVATPGAAGAGGDSDGIAYAAAAADVTTNAAVATTTTSTPAITATDRATTDQHMNEQSTQHDDVPEVGPAHDHSEIEEQNGHGEDAGVV